MYTLLLRLASSLQSWGDESKRNIRKTMNEPTKSAVIGILASALGRKRDEDISDLRNLTFGVRIDQEGKPLRDFQTVRWREKRTDITTRYYLSGAVFLVGIASDDLQDLQELDRVLNGRHRLLYAGRRSCPLTEPISLGIRDADVKTALQEEPWIASQVMQEKRKREFSIPLRIVMDAQDMEPTGIRKDVPISFNPEHRQYAYRPIVEMETIVSNPCAVKAEEEVENMGNLAADSAHDPMEEL